MDSVASVIALKYAVSCITIITTCITISGENNCWIELSNCLDYKSKGICRQEWKKWLLVPGQNVGKNWKDPDLVDIWSVNNERPASKRFCAMMLRLFGDICSSHVHHNNLIWHKFNPTIWVDMLTLVTTQFTILHQLHIFSINLFFWGGGCTIC